MKEYTPRERERERDGDCSRSISSCRSKKQHTHTHPLKNKNTNTEGKAWKAQILSLHLRFGGANVFSAFFSLSTAFGVIGFLHVCLSRFCTSHFPHNLNKQTLCGRGKPKAYYCLPWSCKCKSNPHASVCLQEGCAAVCDAAGWCLFLVRPHFFGNLCAKPRTTTLLSRKWRGGEYGSAPCRPDIIYRANTNTWPRPAPRWPIERSEGGVECFANIRRASRDVDGMNECEWMEWLSNVLQLHRHSASSDFNARHREELMRVRAKLRLIKQWGCDKVH